MFPTYIFLVMCITCLSANYPGRQIKDFSKCKDENLYKNYSVQVFRSPFYCIILYHIAMYTELAVY